MKKSETEQVLPKQETFFSTEKLKRSARAGTHLLDLTMAPYDYDPKARFNHLFSALEQSPRRKCPNPMNRGLYR